MKIMKLKTNKIWKMLVVALVITTAACAQGGPPKGGGQQGGRQQQNPPTLPTAKQIKTMVSDLSKEILLTDEQEAKVLKLYTSHFETMEEKTTAGRPDRNEMEKLKTTFENNIKAILTDNQKKLYTAYLKNNSPEKGKSQRTN
jgi:hypothetical protein